MSTVTQGPLWPSQPLNKFTVDQLASTAHYTYLPTDPLQKSTSDFVRAVRQSLLTKFGLKVDEQHLIVDVVDKSSHLGKAHIITVMTPRINPPFSTLTFGDRDKLKSTCKFLTEDSKADLGELSEITYIWHADDNVQLVYSLEHRSMQYLNNRKEYFTS